MRDDLLAEMIVMFGLIAAGWVVWGSAASTTAPRRLVACVLLGSAALSPLLFGESILSAVGFVLASAVWRFRFLPKDELRQLFGADRRHPAGDETGESGPR